MTPPGEPPVIRLLTGADAAAYWALRCEVREPSVAEVRAAARGAPTVAEIADWLDGGDRWTMGAVVAGDDGITRLRGVATLLRESADTLRHKASVVSVCVAPDVRGHGVTRALLTALITQARTLPGLERLGVAVATTQPAALALYTALGFVPWGTGRAVRGEDGADIDEHYLSLTL